MRKGISLVALIITIIVLVILTGTIVLTAFNNGILEKSEEAVFKSDIQSFQEELTMYIMNKKAEFAYSEVNVIYNDDDNEHYNNMKEYIKSFSKKYASKVQIVKDKIEYIGSNEQEKQWVSGLGVTVNSVEVIGDISDWEIAKETSNQVIIIGYKGSKTKDLEIPNVLTINGVKKEVLQIALRNSINNLSGSIIVPSNVLLSSLPLSQMDDVNKIIIKNNVEIIFGGESFTGNLEEIIIGNNCTITKNFMQVNSIGDITIGDNCTIKEYTCSNLNITRKLSIGKDCNIEWAAFYNAPQIGDVIIGDRTVIAEEAFEGSNISGKVTIGDNVNIGTFAFSGCKSIASFEIGENVVIQNGAIGECTGITGTINIPSSTSVYEEAFYGCSKADIVIYGTLVYEAPDAFNGCKSVTRK